MSWKVAVTPRSFGKSSSLPLDMLKQRGCEVVLNPYGRILDKAEMKELIRDADAVIVGVDPLDADVLSAASRLKVISKYGVGTDNIDQTFAASKGIEVAVAAGANTDAVADYTLALMLAVARRIVPIDQGCRRMDWQKQTAVDVWGKTVGLIGLGAIGKGVARRAKGFDMRVLAYDLYQDPEYAARNGIEYVSLDRLLRESDFISLHLPLTEQTHHIIGPAEFEKMKPTAVLVNTARGGLIDEAALLRVLRENRIWGAGIDVFSQEPPEEKELLQLGNIVIGSHTAASTYQAIENMGVMAAENVLKHMPER
jgi:D-3-phosphoglycerate dehydrogenase